MKKVLSATLAVLLILSLLCCPAFAKSAKNKKSSTKTTVTLSRTGTITLNVGDKIRLKATTKPAGKTVTWSTSKKSVATVSKKGVVTAKAEGTATITAKSGKGKAKVKVKVVNSSKPTGVSIAQGKSITIKKGESVQLTAVLKPKGAQANLKWSTSKKKVATVSASGVVTGQKKGKAKITVKAGKKKATITVNVTADAYVAPAHTHTWEDVTTTVHHEEEGHWEIQQVSTQTGTRQTTINHPEEGHWEQVTESRMVHEAWDEDVVVVDKEAWLEQGVKCMACGKKIFPSDGEYSGAVSTRLEADGLPGQNILIEHWALECPHSIGNLTVSLDSTEDTPENRAWLEERRNRWLSTGENYYEYEITGTYIGDNGKQYLLGYGTSSGNSYGNCEKQHPAETHIEVVHHDAEYQDITSDVWVIDKPGWVETVEEPVYTITNVNVYVVDTPAWDETVVTGRRCTGCGATE